MVPGQRAKETSADFFALLADFWNQVLVMVKQ
jgi:hypothetical protein